MKCVKEIKIVFTGIVIYPLERMQDALAEDDIELAHICYDSCMEFIAESEYSQKVRQSMVENLNEIYGDNPRHCG